MNKKTAVYPGSFDPITIGHVDVINRGAKLYDKLYVVIGENIGKKYLLTLEERLELTRLAFLDIKNVEVVVSSDLTVEFAKKVGACVILRGLRSTTDFDYEYAIATSNSKLAPEIETVFLMSRGEHFHITSSIVREIAKFSGDVSEFVPCTVKKLLMSKFATEK